MRRAYPVEHKVVEDCEALIKVAPMHEQQGAQEAELANGKVRVVDRPHTLLSDDADANVAGLDHRGK